MLGANGAGKTTLLRAILGLADAEGTFRFDGKDISRLSVAERVRLGIALVPEGRRLFPEFTVAENLRIGAFNRTDRAEVERDIDEICEILSDPAGSAIGQQARTLSGGEGQMLATGRALMARPRLLLLDEPSVGLMPRAVAEIFKMIAAIPKKKADHRSAGRAEHQAGARGRRPRGRPRNGPRRAHRRRANGGDRPTRQGGLSGRLSHRLTLLGMASAAGDGQPRTGLALDELTGRRIIFSNLPFGRFFVVCFALGLCLGLFMARLLRHRALEASFIEAPR